MQTKGVLIDLDGTLADTVPDLAAAIDRTMVSLGLEPCGKDRVRGWIGRGLPNIVRRALELRLGHSPTRSEFDHGLEICYDAYQEENGRAGELYPGVTSTLDTLLERGMRLGCVTNKRARFTLPLLRTKGIADRFDVILSGDDVPLMKPDPDPIRLAAGKLGLSLGHVVFVGDTDNDIIAARAAGVPVFGVSYGYHGGTHIGELEPDIVLDSFGELLEHF